MTEPSDSGSDRSAQVPYWQFVPPEDYAVPAVQMHKAAGKAWLSLQNLFRRKNSAATFKAEQDLHALSEVRLEHLVPPLPWDDAAAALDASLPDWLAAGSSATCVKFVVGQPFCGHAEIVSLLGARHRATEVAPPSIEQILSNDESWLEGWPLPETFWVLPKLEHCYLRHASGLNLVRRLLCLATNGDLGQGVIGCDSWAWAYLQRIFPLPQAAAITLQAFDAKRLQNLLYDQMTSRAQQKIHYFNAKNNQEILGPSAEQGQLQKEFVELAAHCRGNVAVATTYWRQRLRCLPDEEAAVDDEKTAMRPGEQVWVAGMPPEPELPIGHEEDFFLLLHAMLLHGGLSESLLGELLPFSAIRGLGLLAQLQQSGIAYCADGRWQVREMAYARVRRLLSARDYLTDLF